MQMDLVNWYMVDVMEPGEYRLDLCVGDLVSPTTKPDAATIVVSGHLFLLYRDIVWESWYGESREGIICHINNRGIMCPTWWKPAEQEISAMVMGILGRIFE